MAEGAIDRGTALVFLRRNGAPLPPGHAGHVGWGFRDADGSYVFGATENGGGAIHVPTGGDNGSWLARGTLADAIAAMSARRYEACKVARFYTANGSAAMAAAARIAGSGYDGVGNNCLDHSCRVLAAYGQPDLPWPATHPSPNEWFALYNGEFRNLLEEDDVSDTRPDAQPQQIDFQEFGIRFVHAAVTPERIAAAVKGSLQPIDRRIDEGVPAGGHADIAGAVSDVSVTELTPDATDPHAAYRLLLTISLRVVANVLSIILPWEGVCHAPVVMELQAFSPLELRFRVRPVLDSDVAAVMEGMNFVTDLAPFKDAVEAAVRTGVAKAINDALAASADKLRIDVRAQLKAADTPPDPAAPAAPGTEFKDIGADQGHAVALAAGDRFQGLIAAEGRGWFTIPLDPTLRAKLDIAGKSLTKSGGTMLRYRVIDAFSTLIDQGMVRVLSETEFWEAASVTLGSVAQHYAAAFLILESDNAALEVRGTLSFQPA